MNETALHSFNDTSLSENEADLGHKFIEIFSKGVISNFVRQSCKPLYFSSHLYDANRFFDPHVAGDHPETMIEFLEKSLLASVKEEAGRVGVFSDLMLPLGLDGIAVECSDEALQEQMQRKDLQPRLIKEEEAWKSVKPCQDLQRKKCELLRFLSQDSMMVDLKISLYITACNNVALKPYPDHVVEETPEGMHGLVFINNLIPPVRVLKDFLDHDSDHLDEHVVDIVHWLSVLLRQPKLVEVPRESYDTIFQRVEYAINLQNPSYMVKLMVNNLSSNHLQWQASKGKQGTKFAFYSTRVEQLHSLIHMGLFPLQKVDGALGKGVYLTSDLKSCLESSPPCWVWGKSTLGTQLQVVAIVEFIANNPKVVGYRDKTAYNKSVSGQKKPYHYYVPFINLVQARFLLVFVNDHHRIAPGAYRLATKRRVTSRMMLHGLFLGLYVSLGLVAWKSLRNASSSNPWDALIGKFQNLNVMKQISQFMSSSSESNSCY